MCKAVEEFGKKERAEGRRDGVVETIRGFIKDGTLSIEKIAEIVKLPVEEIREIASAM